MKKVLLSLIFALLFAGMAMAMGRGSILNLRMDSYQDFSLIMDGNNFGPSQFHRIEGISGGNHFIKVFQQVWSPYENSYRKRTVFAGWVNIPAASEVHAIVSAVQPLFIEKLIALESPVESAHGWNGEPICQHENTHCQPIPPAHCEEVVYQEIPPAPVEMNPYDFEALKNSLQQASFESNRLIIAKQAIAANYVSSVQVKELMAIMWFESSRLELAKFAYDKVIDRNNYYRINDAFWFSSSVDELHNYLAVN